MVIQLKARTQVSWNAVVMGGSAGGGGVSVTGPDVAAFPQPDDGGLRRAQLLLQAFLRQRRRWAAALEGVLGGRTALLHEHGTGGGAGRHMTGLT